MKLVTEDQKCDFIIEEKGKTTRLRLNDRPFEVRMIPFKPANEKQVSARRVKSGRFFKAAGTSARTAGWRI